MFCISRTHHRLIILAAGDGVGTNLLDSIDLDPNSLPDLELSPSLEPDLDPFSESVIWIKLLCYGPPFSDWGGQATKDRIQTDTICLDAALVCHYSMPLFSWTLSTSKDLLAAILASESVGLSWGRFCMACISFFLGWGAIVPQSTKIKAYTIPTNTEKKIKNLTKIFTKGHRRLTYGSQGKLRAVEGLRSKQSIVKFSTGSVHMDLVMIHSINYESQIGFFVQHQESLLASIEPMNTVWAVV